MTNREDLCQAFLAHRREHGIRETNKILNDTFGTNQLDDIPEDQWPDAIAALSGTPAATQGQRDTTLDAAKIYAKWNGPWKRSAES